ncbi:hypothetical protein Tco_1117723 [Tanacetum coccineum]
MEEEYKNEIWTKLKQDVINVMESGAYPSIELIGEWSLSQMDYFYNNCHKYGLDPSFEEDDVATEDGGIANEMRHEDVDSEALCIDNDGAKLGDVSNV